MGQHLKKIITKEKLKRFFLKFFILKETLFRKLYLIFSFTENSLFKKRKTFFRNLYKKSH